MSCKDALLGATDKRAVVEQRLRFSDSVKDQEKALAKLKIQQELSETLVEKAIYWVAFNEENHESEGESVQHLPTGFGNIIDTFLHDQESYFPTQPSVVQPLNKAVPDVFNGEEKDKTRFFPWETAFNALIDSAPVTSQQKPHLLFQHLEGRAKKVVEQLQFLSTVFTRV